MDKTEAASAALNGILHVYCAALHMEINAFCSSGLGLTVCLSLLVDLPVANMLPGLIGYAHTVGVLLLLMSYTLHECPVLQPLEQRYAALFSTTTDTMRSFFAQQDHMQVLTLFWIVLISLDYDLCLFFYMRSDLLAG